MIKKLLSISVACLMCCTLSIPAFAREGRGGNDASWILYDAGILRGSGKTYADGSPNLEYNSKATRSQAAIMFVRLLGEEEEALRSNLPTRL